MTPWGGVFASTAFAMVRQHAVMAQSYQVFGAGSAMANGVYHPDELKEYNPITDWQKTTNPKT